VEILFIFFVERGVFGLRLSHPSFIVGGMKQAPMTPIEFAEMVDELSVAASGLAVGSLSETESSKCLRVAQSLRSLASSLESRVLSNGQRGSASLVAATGMSQQAAKKMVRVAETLRTAPLMSEALAAGTVSQGHVEALTFGVPKLERRGAGSDPELLAAAKTQGVDEFVSTVKHWVAKAQGDLDGQQLAARQHRDRKACWFTRSDGMIRIEADLPPETGGVVVGVLEKASDQLWRHQDQRSTRDQYRSVAQRNADALVAVFSGAQNKPGNKAKRPNVDLVVHVDHQALVDGVTAAGVRCHSANGDSLPLATVRKLACDASVIPLVMNGDGVPLDIGRKTRTTPEYLRKALIARDQGCVFPGCDYKPGWCEAHHVDYWENGGSTSLDNLVLLCSNHHHVIHQNPWQLKPDLDHPGRWIFISPAGAQTPGNIHHQTPEPEPVDKPKIEPKPVTPKPRAREPVP